MICLRCKCAYHQFLVRHQAGKKLADAKWGFQSKVFFVYIYAGIKSIQTLRFNIQVINTMKKVGHSIIDNFHISLYIGFILLKSFGQLEKLCQSVHRSGSGI